MSQDDQPESTGRFNPKPLLIWLLLVTATIALVQYSAPSIREPQKLENSQVLAYAQDRKIKNAKVQPDRSGGTDN